MGAILCFTLCDIGTMYDFDPKKDYYSMLGVSESATTEEIKKAFKKLAVQHHPDKQGGDQKKFQEINEAHQILSDDRKRQQYDAVRKGGFGGFGGGSGGGGFGGFGGGGGGFDVEGFDIGDIVGNIFGGGVFGGFGGSGARGGKKVRQGDDIKLAMDITFEEAFLGVKKTISYSRRVMAEGVQQDTCTACGGAGAVMQQAQTPFGVMQVQSACSTCGGSGILFTKDGKSVPNDGLEKIKETLDVNVPAGIKDGVYVKFSGKANAGIGGGGMGDLYIKITVKPSALYERRGDDLYVKTSVSIYDLVLGGTCEVNHPEGKLTVKIPKGTQVDDMIKIASKGYGDTSIFSKKGNLYVIPQVSIPKKLSKEQEKLWNDLKASIS